MLATWLLVLLILIPLVAFSEIGRALGKGVLGRLLKGRPEGRGEQS
jgi:hypothetical protein